MSLFERNRTKSTSISRTQKQLVTEYMEAHPELGKRPGTRNDHERTVQRWQELTDLLNGVQGPAKDWKDWRRTWQSMKSNAKKSKKNLNVRGVGEPVSSPLDKVEETLAAIVNEVPISSDPHTNEFALQELNFSQMPTSAAYTELTPLVPMKAADTHLMLNVHDNVETDLIPMDVFHGLTSNVNIASIDSSTAVTLQTDNNNLPAICKNSNENFIASDQPGSGITKFGIKTGQLENAVETATDLSLGSHERKMMQDYYSNKLLLMKELLKCHVESNIIKKQDLLIKKKIAKGLLALAKIDDNNSGYKD